MSKVQLIPYLTFNGNTKEAMDFYHSVVDGELKVQTFAEASMEVPEDRKDKIVHAELKSDDITFMASDSMPDRPVKMGENINMSLIGTDEAKLKQYFEKLSDGGEITMPMEKQFWGDTFGMVKDKFDINWMVNISAEQ